MVARIDVAAVLESRSRLTPTCYVARFRLPRGMPRPAPGQFVMVRPAQGEPPFWRRAYSVAGFSEDGAGALLELMVKVVGPGTALWLELPLGTRALLLGPLGNGFRLEPAAARVALVAGGIGLPPVRFAIPRLAANRSRCDLYLGALTAAEVLDPEGCRRDLATVDGELVVATDDGTAGEAGRVTEVFERHLEGGVDYDLVLGCGPMPMLRALAAVTARRGLPAQLALEERMGCGVGVCLGCIVPTADGSHVRLCTEGPVLDAAAVDWEVVC